jgi:hypothetical protein
MNFKNFDDIGDSEPRAWSHSIGTKFGKDEDDDEVPVPYCDEFDDESSDEDPVEEEEDAETETETESVGSAKKNPLKRKQVVVGTVLQEELDFMAE